MKNIGLIGGMSWESTAIYYQGINKGIAHRLGGLNSAQITLRSLNFSEIAELQSQEKWSEIADMVSQAALAIERAGADMVLITTNTIHKIANEITRNLSIPLVNIIDATAESLIQDRIETVGLLGTRFTMEQSFYKEKLKKEYGINVVVPECDDRERIHRIIFQELCLGDIRPASREAYLAIMQTMALKGAQGIVLGCTEIPMLIHQTHFHLPIYDTTRIHIEKAIQLALSDQ